MIDNPDALDTIMGYGADSEISADFILLLKNMPK